MGEHTRASMLVVATSRGLDSRAYTDQHSLAVPAAPRPLAASKHLHMLAQGEHLPALQGTGLQSRCMPDSRLQS